MDWLFGRSDAAGNVAALELVTGVVDVSLEGVFAVLGEGGVSYGGCMPNQWVDVL